MDMLDILLTRFRSFFGSEVATSAFVKENFPNRTMEFSDGFMAGYQVAMAQALKLDDERRGNLGNLSNHQ